MNRVIPVTNKIIPVTDPDVVLYLGNYTSQEARGSIALEKSRYGNHGGLSGDVRWQNFGGYGQALKFGGVNGQVDCGNDSSLNFDGTAYYTWLGWIKTSMSSQNILGKGAFWSKGFVVSLYNSTLLFTDLETTSGVLANTGISDNKKHYFGITYSNGGAISFFVDGESDGGGTLAGGSATSDTTNNFFIGKNLYGNWLSGIVGEIKMIKRKLTLEEYRQEMYSSWVYRMLRGVR